MQLILLFFLFIICFLSLFFGSLTVYICGCVRVVVHGVVCVVCGMCGGYVWCVCVCRCVLFRYICV